MTLKLRLKMDAEVGQYFSESAGGGWMPSLARLKDSKVED